jgi:MFS family permease
MGTPPPVDSETAPTTAALVQADAPRAAWRFRDWFDLVAMASTHGLSDSYDNLLVPVLALIVADLGLSPLEAGFILSARSVASFLLLYPVSLLADALDRRKEILLAGLALTTLAFSLMPLAGGLPAVVILAFVAGAGNAVFHPCGTALTARRFAARKAVAISIHGLGGNVGTSIMPLVQSAVVALAGWRAAIAACGLPALVLLPIIAVRFPSGERRRGGGEAVAGGPAFSRLMQGFRHLTSTVLRNRTVVLLGLVYLLEGMGSKGMIGFLPLLATQRFALDTVAIGVAVSAYYTTGIAAKALMGFLYDRWGARAALIVPLLLSSALGLAVGLTPWQATLVPLVAMLGITSPISPVILTAAADSSEDNSLASAVGFIYTCYGLGFLSPLIGGWLAKQWGFVASYYFFTAAILAAALVAALLPRTLRPPRPESKV